MPRGSTMSPSASATPTTCTPRRASARAAVPPSDPKPWTRAVAPRHRPSVVVERGRHGLGDPVPGGAVAERDAVDRDVEGGRDGSRRRPRIGGPRHEGLHRQTEAELLEDRGQPRLRHPEVPGRRPTGEQQRPHRVDVAAQHVAGAAVLWIEGDAALRAAAQRSGQRLLVGHHPGQVLDLGQRHARVHADAAARQAVDETVDHGEATATELRIHPGDPQEGLRGLAPK